MFTSPENELDTGFWLGLLLALPIGIVTNLLTPRIQKIMASYSSRIAEKRRKEEREFMESIARYRSDQPAYWSFLHLSLSRVLFLVALLLVAAIAPFTISDVLYEINAQLIYIVNICTLIYAVIPVRLIRNEIRRSRAVARGVLNKSEPESGKPKNDNSE